MHDSTLKTCCRLVARASSALSAKSDDEVTNKILSALHDDDSLDRVTCERSLNARLGGSCSTPIAAFSELEGGTLRMRAMVGLPDGSRVLRASGTGPRTEARELGLRVAEDLLAQGADEIIASFGAS